MRQFKQLKTLRQVGGPETPLPNTTLLSAHHFGDNFRSFKKDVLRLGLTMEELLPACPVAVFSSPNRHIFVRAEDDQVLMDYARKLAEQKGPII